MLIICMITCAGFAWLLHIMIEKPFMQLRSRIIKRKEVYADGLKMTAAPVENNPESNETTGIYGKR